MIKAATEHTRACLQHHLKGGAALSPSSPPHQHMPASWKQLQTWRQLGPGRSGNRLRIGRCGFKAPPPSPVPWRNPAQVTSSFCVPASRVRETGSHRRDLARRAAERGTQCRRCESIVPARARKAARRGRKRGLEQPMHPPAGRGCYSIPRQRDVPAPQPRRDSFFSSKTETATHVLRDLVVCCKDKVAFLVCERTSETNAM